MPDPDRDVRRTVYDGDGNPRPQRPPEGDDAVAAAHLLEGYLRRLAG